MENLVLDVNGMSCEHCVKAIKDELMEQNGVKSVQVDLSDKKVCVEYNPEDISVKTIKDVITETGYEVAE